MTSDSRGNEDDPQRKPKTLVLCLDGTQNEFGNSPFSNSLKFFRLLNKDDPSQLCYYQPGVGVNFGSNVNEYDPRGVVSRNIRKFGHQLDAVFAYTLQLHVRAAYIFLMRFYKEGDKICLIGFSRGSFAARILAGMLESIGLMNRGSEDLVSTAWDIYSSWENEGQPTQDAYSTSLLLEFKKTFCRSSVKIHFMGLFDSVNSVGLFRDRLFPYTSRTSIVAHTRHAVSLDERRGKFKQVLFQPFSYYPHLTDLEYEECKYDFNEADKSMVLKGFAYIRQLIDMVEGWLFSRKTNKRIEDDCFCQDIKEVWFPGNHGDVGGGWVPDEGTNQSLSNISLRWMLAEAVELGILFKPGAISDFDLAFPVISSVLSYNHDILAFPNQPQPMNFNNNVSRLELPDYQLFGSKISGNSNIFQAIFWWMIELLPIGIKIEDETGKWKSIYIPNLGRLRKVPQNASLHWSVFYRMHYFQDYYPKNLQLDLGYAFMELVKWVNDKLYLETVRDFATDLTLEKIKHDRTDLIWKTIPDELHEPLKHNPNL